MGVGGEFKWLISLGLPRNFQGVEGTGMTNEIAAAAQNANEMCNSGWRWAELLGCSRTIGFPCANV